VKCLLSIEADLLPLALAKSSTATLAAVTDRLPRHSEAKRAECRDTRGLEEKRSVIRVAMYNNIFTHYRVRNKGGVSSGSLPELGYARRVSNGRLDRTVRAASEKKAQGPPGR
jgi:hypothetical protein